MPDESDKAMLLNRRCFAGVLSARRGLALALVVGLLAGCGRSGSEQGRVLESREMAFEDLFALEDTIRLDPSILIGSIEALDVSDTSDLLVDDDVGQAVHVFDATGRHRSTLDTDECGSGDESRIRWSRFIGDSRVMSIRSSTGYVFDEHGNCIMRNQSAILMEATALCTHVDTLFVFRGEGYGSAAIVGLTKSMTQVTEVPVPPFKFPLLNSTYLALPGRDLGCFDDGVWYITREDVDAWPMHRTRDRLRHRPHFFKDRSRDVPPVTDPRILRVLDEATSAIAVFALTGSTRLVVYTTPGPNLGLSVTDHAHGFAVSTTTPETPRATANGYAYFVGDNEILADSTVGNPVIIRYRFLPPQVSDG